MKKVMVTVNDGYDGGERELEAVIGAEDKIYLQGPGVCYWSGEYANREYQGTNQIALQVRHNSSVIGLRVV